MSDNDNVVCVCVCVCVRERKRSHDALNERMCTAIKESIHHYVVVSVDIVATNRSMNEHRQV